MKSEAKIIAIPRAAARLNSRNFLVSIMSIVFLVFAYWGADVAPDAGESLIDAIMSGNLTAVFMAIFVNLVNPIMKIRATAKENGGLDWGFVRSLNFWVQVGSVLILLLGTIGLFFPADAVEQIVGAIQSGDVGLIILALVTNLINPIIHYFRDRDKPLPQKVVQLKAA